MKYIDLPLKDAKLLRLTRHGDSRGWVTEDFRESWMSDAGIKNKFIFDYSSFSSNANTLRGMHAQSLVTPLSKLVSVFNGSIMDVLVDARVDSPTYGQWCKIILSQNEPSVIYIPRGFYHGFLTLEPNTYVNYKLDNYYDENEEIGFNATDSSLNILWEFVDSTALTVSHRDSNHPNWDNCYKFQGLI